MSLQYDVDKDGVIPLRDLKNVLKSGGDLKHDFPDHVIDEIVEWADLNNDGVLNYNEFLRMVCLSLLLLHLYLLMFLKVFKQQV